MPSPSHTPPQRSASRCLRGPLAALGLAALVALGAGCGEPPGLSDQFPGQTSQNNTSGANNTSGTNQTSGTNNTAGPNNTNQTNQTSGTNNTTGPDACAEQLKPTPVRRLSHFEYRNTLRDLYPDITMPNLTLRGDDRRHEFDNDAVKLTVDRDLADQYLDIGRDIAEALGDRIDDLAPCKPADDAPMSEVVSCGEQFVRAEGERLFRRPLTEEQVQAYAFLFSEEIEGATWRIRLRLTLQLLLSAPEFLYRFEGATEQVAAGGTGTLDAYSLATRLSYFAWGTTPDAALYAAAKDGSLLQPDVYREHAERLLNDDRAKDMFLHFHEQWLEFDRIASTSKKTEDNLDDSMRQALVEQGKRFVGTVLFDERGSLADLMTSPRTFVNADLARLYNVEAPGEGWVEVTREDRVGFLTQPLFLASHAHPDKSSPVLRGNFVLERVVCSPVGPPPPNAEAAGNAKADELEGPLTNREVYHLTTASEVPCKGCHVRINPPGYALEHYDTMGRWRDQEASGLPIDPSGSFDDVSFTNARDLMTQLSTSTQYQQCAVQKWMRFAYAGGDIEESTCMNQDLQERMVAEGGSIRDLQLAIALHPWFSTFRAPEQTEE